MRKYNDIRAWGVWFDLISDLAFVSVNKSDCSALVRGSPPSVRERLKIVRLDLSPLYRDNNNK